jgi:hypothetical protein
MASRYITDKQLKQMDSLYIIGRLLLRKRVFGLSFVFHPYRRWPAIRKNKKQNKGHVFKNLLLEIRFQPKMIAVK